MNKGCGLCPRHCGADRAAGERGFCGAGAIPRIFRYGPHFGEEPPITGTSGSGTVFFSHCTMSCCYCQNYPWSQEHQGTDYDENGLRDILRSLAQAGCHNWNLVTPTPWLPQIRAAATPLIEGDKRLPFVYNTSGFEDPETLADYRDLMDIALTDLRYARETTAIEASNTPGYVAAARATLSWFWHELGPLRLDPNGIATRGTVCRLLVLPGHAEETIENLEWMADSIGTKVAISLMSQYRPVHRAQKMDAWDREVTRTEYRLVTDAAENLGFCTGWIQPYDDTASAGLLGCRMPAGQGAVGEQEGKV